MNNKIEEWKILQQQVDNYEHWSLLIKLCQLAVLLFFISSSEKTVSMLVAILVMLVVWLQDAIWKTFQARSESRLILLEQAMADDFAQVSDSPLVPFQFNCHFIMNRPSTLGLIQEYFKQALRPTVAFPHLAFIVVFIIHLMS